MRSHVCTFSLYIYIHDLYKPHPRALEQLGRWYMMAYHGISMLLIQDQIVGPFLVVVPLIKPETKCAPQFSCFDFWHSGSTSETFLGDLKRLLDPYLLCLLLTESCMMGAYVTFNANVSTLAAGWWESCLIDTFQGEDMFLDVLCPRSKFICLEQLTSVRLFDTGLLWPTHHDHIDGHVGFWSPEWNWLVGHEEASSREHFPHC